MLHSFTIYHLFGILIVNILIGVAGLSYFENLNFLDSFTNTCLTISTMGPKYYPETTKGKVFLSLFSLYSGLFFIAVFSVLFHQYILKKIKF